MAKITDKVTVYRKADGTYDYKIGAKKGGVSTLTPWGARYQGKRALAADPYGFNPTFTLDTPEMDAAVKATAAARKFSTARRAAGKRVEGATWTKLMGREYRTWQEAAKVAGFRGRVGVIPSTGEASMCYPTVVVQREVFRRLGLPVNF
jgi:hypothetical protein